MEPLTVIPQLFNSRDLTRYNEGCYSYKRRPTREVMVGDVGIGGSNPIRIQSMTTSDTMDTKTTVAQTAALVEAGCEIVRITAPSIKDAENLRNIKHELRRLGIKVPLVADIHFTPNAAMKAAEYVEKIRINPGNYADKKKFTVIEYSDDDYDRELERIAESFKPLVLRCKENGIAMRIGTNHGSLSDRIMNRYGDTPLGMVESALEFVRICELNGYYNLVLSMKSSNPQVMIAAYRMLAARMYELGMDYPFHLGVTEAGDGEDGRIKSAVGIGALLWDGIGDTIRVSLTEDSVHEIPAAMAIAERFKDRLIAAEEPARYKSSEQESRNPYQYSRRWSQTVEVPHFNYGGIHHVRVAMPLRSSLGDPELALQEIKDLTKHGSLEITRAEIIECILSRDQDAFAFGKVCEMVRREGIAVALMAKVPNNAPWVHQAIQYADILSFVPAPDGDEMLWRNEWTAIIKAIRTYEKKAIHVAVSPADIPKFIRRSVTSPMVQLVETIVWISKLFQELDFRNFSIAVDNHEIIFANRLLAARLAAHRLDPSIVISYRPQGAFQTLFDASSQIGSLLCDGIGDMLMIDDPRADFESILRLNYNLLQATRLRISKTEFISCPSCGRTLFDLQEVTARIKSKTGHLKGVKIAIMGCIVNGPGEMADADFGYVGSSAGKINLYVGKSLVERNIDMVSADQRLVDLIKSKGMWSDPV